LTKISRFAELVNQFGRTMEELWRFYELVEETTEVELQENAIERMLDENDVLKYYLDFKLFGVQSRKGNYQMIIYLTSYKSS
jgi:hypothetical protein